MDLGLSQLPLYVGTGSMHTPCHNYGFSLSGDPPHHSHSGQPPIDVYKRQAQVAYFLLHIQLIPLNYYRTVVSITLFFYIIFDIYNGAV